MRLWWDFALMDPTAIVTGLLGAGPMGLVAGVCFFFYLRSEQRNRELVDKLLDLSVTTTTALKDLSRGIEAAIQIRRQ